MHMCGLAAVSLGSGSPDPDLLRRLGSRLPHRGPVGEGAHRHLQERIREWGASFATHSDSEASSYLASMVQRVSFVFDAGARLPGNRLSKVDGCLAASGLRRASRHNPHIGPEDPSEALPVPTGGGSGVGVP